MIIINNTYSLGDIVKLRTDDGFTKFIVTSINVIGIDEIGNATNIYYRIDNKESSIVVNGFELELIEKSDLSNDKDFDSGEHRASL